MESICEKIDLTQITTEVPCFLLLNVLTPVECAQVVENFEKIDDEDKDYTLMSEYRKNQRRTKEDKELSSLIWSRVHRFIPHELTINGTKWGATGLNNTWKFVKYEQGGYFAPHVDSRSKTQKEESWLTFMIYLNGPSEGAFKGGCTNFLSCTSEGDVKMKLTPTTGTALVFMQEDYECYHEGEEISEGIKCVVRTDVMYTKRD